MDFTEGVAQYYFTTVRITTVRNDGRTGFGTAFFFAHQTEESLANGTEYTFLVTNKHVIEDSIDGSFFLTERGADGKPVVGSQLTAAIANFEQAWHGHPSPDVDIAVLALGGLIGRLQPNNPVFFRSLGTPLLPSAQEINEIHPLDPVVFIGYPNGIFDSKNLLPVARKGTLPSPLAIDYEGAPQFLIDASVFPGSSGSPVLTDGVVWRFGENEELRWTARTKLIGVLSGGFFIGTTGEVVETPIPTTLGGTVTVDQMIDLGVVIKSSMIVEAIEDKLRKDGII